MRKFLAILVLSVSAIAAAHANPDHSSHGGRGWTSSQWQSWENWLEQFDNWFDQDPHHQGPGGPVAAPEFGPAGAIVGLSLLAGGLAVVRGKRAKK